ncbi:hypothetical protein KA977_08595 [Candidatus Dependentiae bacterium]|nr:hypothetical protein [Candidatus Dependentiae bacterium]
MTEDKKLEVKKTDYVAPDRVNIREELKKVSNFNDDELAILNWSSLYKCHSLIVKYGEQGIEEDFRKQEWFQKELKKYIENKPADAEPEKNENRELTKEEKKELRRKEKEQNRQKKQEERKQKKEERERKKRVKQTKEKFEEVEFKMHEFYGFLNELAKSKEKIYEMTLVDGALIQVKRSGKPYFNIFVDEGKIVFKRGEI